ncbi:extracellular solute-binding protein [Tuanshanicoccus lijuaniae]|uniref:ABC transporter substrate-binding protein n=1 Tax=Aerococcaceae bacterium zg-1292 TaxID=2774330 RepID=UPI001934C1E1|nr:extracellular solute-binding protein [Aerococcaceae bacterium zg-1292]MBF6626000.1 extracellular solute-binding protein [Aerococcaceae bacterium zg-BR9]MBF6978910.1 extracellular solute-binding protein [Aerococcaceae bacterium zg-BR22]MBS4455344.1 extracellular solute-binding protein [Aerococcaceae bacterium zg-A91]MBS4457304.1 extracellular solute-binding protein [Aerococcaceae bacterium zg-BR33]
MKKLFAKLALAGLVLTSLPFNALQSVTAQEKVKINFINGFTGGDGAFMKKITDGFNASQDKYEINEIQEADHYTKFTTGDFDLVVMHNTNIATFKTDGMIQDMTGVFEKAGISLDDFHPAAKDVVQFSDGGIYGAPLDIHPLTTFYNKEFVEKAPETIEDLKAINEKVKAENDNLFALGIPDTGLIEFYIFLIAAQNNVELLKDGYLNFNQEAMADALMTFHDLIYKDKVSPAGLGLDGEFQAFMSKASADTAQTVVSLTGPWYYQAVRDTYGDKLGIGHIPNLGKTPALYGNGHNISVSASVTDEEKLAGIAEFFAYLYQPENLINWADAGQAPLHLATMKLIEENKDKYPLAYQNQTQFDNYVAAPKVYQFGEQVRYMNETVFGRLVREENLTKEDLMKELEQATQLAQEIGSMGSVE